MRSLPCTHLQVSPCLWFRWMLTLPIVRLVMLGVYTIAAICIGCMAWCTLHMEDAAKGRIKCARSAYADSSVYIYMYVC